MPHSTNRCWASASKVTQSSSLPSGAQNPPSPKNERFAPTKLSPFCALPSHPVTDPVVNIQGTTLAAKKRRADCPNFYLGRITHRHQEDTGNCTRVFTT